MLNDPHEKALYHSRVLDIFLKLLRSRYPAVDREQLLAYAGIHSYEVADQSHWFTQKQVDLFHEKLVQMTGNKNIALEAGRFSASPEVLGSIRQYVLGMLSPVSAYELINNTASNFTRSTTFTTTRLGPNEIEVVATPLEGVNEKPYQCENRRGLLESVAVLFNNTLPEVIHDECMFKGAKHCKYIVSWKMSRSFLLKQIRLWLTLGLTLFNLFCLVLLQLTATTLLLIFSASLVAVLAICLAAAVREKHEIIEYTVDTHNSLEKMFEQTKLNYVNAVMHNDISRVLSTCTSTPDVLANVSALLENRLDYDRGLILIANHDRSVLEARAWFGYTEQEAEFVEKLSFNLKRGVSQGMFIVSFKEKKSFLVNDIFEHQAKLSERSLDLARKMGARSFICCPIISHEESLGILAVDNKTTKRPLIQSDMSLLHVVAASIGSSLSNAELIESKVRQFNSLLQTLAASIDARDSMTSGHSAQVTEYAVGICRELGLSEEQTEVVRIAGLLHDYGKIGISDAILKKPSTLDPEEFEIIKSHAQKTHDILKEVNFEGIYQEVPIIAASHHEKLDGSGYPRGLKGDAIPFGARIIAVADYFEAITSQRHYRDPMPVAIALELLVSESGISFDPVIVHAFVHYYAKANLGDGIVPAFFLPPSPDAMVC
jgi:putative nucleotidyltransferase with HDIG domain